MIHRPTTKEPTHFEFLDCELPLFHIAKRTAFIARFIVLRENKRSRAHRLIEKIGWNKDTTAEELAEIILQAFKKNGDNLGPIRRDINKALGHADRTVSPFIKEYAERASTNFVDALYDYEKSNQFLFGKDATPKTGGWRLPDELAREILSHRALLRS